MNVHIKYFFNIEVSTEIPSFKYETYIAWGKSKLEKIKIVAFI